MVHRAEFMNEIKLARLLSIYAAAQKLGDTNDGSLEISVLGHGLGQLI